MKVFEMDGKKWILAPRLADEIGLDKESIRRWYRFKKAESTKIGKEIAFLLADPKEREPICAIFEDHGNVPEEIAKIRRWFSDDPFDFEWEIADSKLTKEQREARKKLVENWRTKLEKMGIKGTVPGWLIYTRLRKQARTR